MITRHILTILSPGDMPPRKVHYRRCGSGPVLLMVHQSPRSSAEYERLMGEWGAHFTCIAPDTPGYGQSDPLPGLPEIAEFADALCAFLDGLGVNRCLAYGVHSGSMILINAMNRQPRRFDAVAAGGYAIWTDDERRMLAGRYLPEFLPRDYGEHLTWLWNRILEQGWFYPWFDASDVARLPRAHADPAKVQGIVMEMLDAGDAYRFGYGAVLRASREVPRAEAAMPPVLISTCNADPLQSHIDRLGPVPATWSARKVTTPQEHEDASIAFLLSHVTSACPVLAEDDDEGFLPIGSGLIHWQGQLGAERLVLHGPGAELRQPAAGCIAIDVPGHGLSTQFSDYAATITAVADAWGARAVVYPQVPKGELALLYPDLAPNRYGSHLLIAWSAARAEAIFQPWYAASAAHAIAIDQAALAPATIALRARARLRAGGAAREWHEVLAGHG